MKILWMTWKDCENPHAGGAELINEEIARRLTRDGHEVILITAGFNGAEGEIEKNGYKVIRLGNRYTVYWQAYRYYKKNLQGWADLVIDEMNTVPFFCKWYVKEQNIILSYQLCREIWFYQLHFPFSLIGYILEPIYLRMLNDRFVITESQSAKLDMMRYGFKKENITVIPVGISLTPVNSLAEVVKYPNPTVLSLGSFRPMKRTLDQIRAYEIAKKSIPNLQLKIAGSALDGYGKKILNYLSSHKYKKDIEYLGRINENQKKELLQKSHLILVTSKKEGWGLIVSEANSQGTPAIVYEVDGLRDSVKNKITGIICEENTPESVASEILKQFNSPKEYQKIQESAWTWSKELTFENCYQHFLSAVIQDKLKNNTPQLIFYIGTEAELIKLFPVIQKCFQENINFILIFTGQNEIRDSILFTEQMRSCSIFLLEGKIWFPFKSFSMRALWFVFWAVATFYRTCKTLYKIKKTTIGKPQFIVHGDTISTVIGAVAAKLFGLPILHIESGLSSGMLFNPFPEEINRRIVMRLANYLFCPSITSFNFVSHFKNKALYQTHGNTMWDMLNYGLEHSNNEKNSPYFLLIIHRQETLAKPELFFNIINTVNQNRPKNLQCLFILHHPTKGFLDAHKKYDEVKALNEWILLDRLPFFDFISLLKNAQFVLTDGGTNQEECYYLGTPCYLLRESTERTEGIEKNVVIRPDFLAKIPWFMENFNKYKMPQVSYSQSPSEIIFTELKKLCIK